MPTDRKAFRIWVREILVDKSTNIKDRKLLKRKTPIGVQGLEITEIGLKSLTDNFNDLLLRCGSQSGVKSDELTLEKCPTVAKVEDLLWFCLPDTNANR